MDLIRACARTEDVKREKTVHVRHGGDDVEDVLCLGPV